MNKKMFTKVLLKQNVQNIWNKKKNKYDAIHEGICVHWTKSERNVWDLKAVSWSPTGFNLKLVSDAPPYAWMDKIKIWSILNFIKSASL